MRHLSFALPLVACLLCLLVYMQADISLRFFIITCLVGLGLWVPWYRGVVAALIAVVSLLLLFWFHTKKMMGGADLFQIIPDLLAIVADTNPGEVRATLINLWSPNELLVLLFLLVCGLLFVRLRRRSLSLALRRLMAGVSLAALVFLALTPDFILSKTVAGIDEAWQVYADNLHNARQRQSFRWHAEAGYPGRDTVVLVLGETTRGDHLGINGYVRNTTPRLAQTEGVISYTQAISNANYTLLSTPIIMTRSMGQTDNLVFPETSLISAYK